MKMSKGSCVSAVLFGIVSTLSVVAEAQIECVEGVNWSFSIVSGKAVLGGDAGLALPSGSAADEIVIPDILGGAPVTTIGKGAFVFTNAVTVLIPATVTKLSNFAFVGSTVKSGISSPYSAVCYLPTSYVGVDYLFEGEPPTVIDDSTVQKSLSRFILTDENDRVEANAQFWGATIQFVNAQSGWKNYMENRYLGGFAVLAQVPAPQISPDSATYSTKTMQTVTLSCAVVDAKIYYTLDGSEPTTSSTLYTGPITICSTTTVRAIALIDGWKDSEIAEATYTFTTIINDAVANALNVDDETAFTLSYRSQDWSVVTNPDYSPSGSGLSLVSGVSANGETGASEPGVPRTISFVVSEPGTLTFNWKVDCQTSGGESGSGFAVVLKEGLNVKDSSGVPYRIETGNWQTGSIECTQEELDDHGGHLVLTWAYTSRNFDKATLSSDGLRLAEFAWASAE